MADNAEQRRLQSLLRFAATAGSHGSDSNTESNVNPEDRAWLNEAIKHYAANTFDPVRYIKQELSKIHRFLHPSQEEDKNVDIEDIYEALEGISDNCDNYDLARDLHKVGGFDVMIQCLQHSDSGLRWRSCDVIAVAAQNHEYCQNALVEMKVLPILLQILEGGTSEKKVREKAFYALSCIVRGNDNALDHFEKNDGFSTLIKVLQSDIPRLKIKSIFFVKSLCQSDPKYARILHERGIEIQLLAMLKDVPLDSASENLTIVENLLSCVQILISISDQAKREFCIESYGLPSLLKKMVSHFTSKEEYEESLQSCKNILESCFSSEEGPDDR